MQQRNIYPVIASRLGMDPGGLFQAVEIYDMIYPVFNDALVCNTASSQSVVDGRRKTKQCVRSDAWSDRSSGDDRGIYSSSFLLRFFARNKAAVRLPNRITAAVPAEVASPVLGISDPGITTAEGSSSSSGP